MVTKRLTQDEHDEAVGRPINLLKGYPSPSLFPTSHLSESATRILSNPRTSTPALLYGADEGFTPLRVALAKWLDEFYGHARRSYAAHSSSALALNDSRRPEDEFDAEEGSKRITITGGASQSLAVILSTFTDPSYTQYVWMAVPAYYLSFKIFQDAGFAGRLKPVPEDEEGVDVGYLRRELENICASNTKPHGEPTQWKGYKPMSVYQKVFRHAIYVVPTFANPSSRSMSLSRREALVKLAREHDALIVCDDVYDMLQWPRERDASRGPWPDTSVAQLPRLVDVDRHLSPTPSVNNFGNVISNGSFSKILGPGIRTGWIDAAPALAHRLSQTGCQKSGGAPSQFAAVCISDMLERELLQDHVSKVLRPAYEKRWRMMRNAIRESLERLGIEVVEQKPGHGSEGLAGGYFIWIILPDRLDAIEVAKLTRERGLVIAVGKVFEVPTLEEGVGDDGPPALNEDRSKEWTKSVSSPNRFPRSLRLCFSYEDEALLGKGVQRLATVVQGLQESL